MQLRCRDVDKTSSSAVHLALFDGLCMDVGHQRSEYAGCAVLHVSGCDRPDGRAGLVLLVQYRERELRNTSAASDRRLR